MHEPSPEQYNRPLTWTSHAWRAALAVAITAGVWPLTAKLQWEQARLLFFVDLGFGLVALALSFYRRRWPLTVAVVTNLMSALSVSSAGPAALTAVSLATRRVLWQIVVVGVVAMSGAMIYPMVGPSPSNDPWWLTFAFGLALVIALLVWGMYLGSRRELLWTLRDRAERAETQQELRVARGRSNERARIAREMHDVLAHRISLITMHAGALAYRTDLSPEEIHETAELIQSKSHEALTDLRQVLGVLRNESGATLLDSPQPTFEDLRSLIDEADETGMRVRYVEQVPDSAAVPDQVGRTTYRIVQEGLTNARKHAPGVTVLVSVSGSTEGGVEIVIRNPARSWAGGPEANGVPTPGAGLGLVGLSERASLAGGRLETRTVDGTFELRGWLPWTT